jgi:hypothetical protein
MAQETCCSNLEGYLRVKQLRLHETNSGYLKGAERQYRDSQGMNSVHAREFPEKFCFHYDKYNPEQYPIEHFFADVLKPEAVLAGGLIFLLALVASKNLKSALGLSLGVGTCVQLLVDN